MTQRGSSQSETSASDYPGTMDATVFQLDTLFNHIETSTTPPDTNTVFTTPQQEGTMSTYISELPNANRIPSHSGNENGAKIKSFPNRLSPSVPSSKLDYAYNDAYVEQQFNQSFELSDHQHQQSFSKIPQLLQQENAFPGSDTTGGSGYNSDQSFVTQANQAQSTYGYNNNGSQYPRAPPFQQSNLSTSNLQVFAERQSPPFGSFPQRPPSIRQQSLPVFKTNNVLQPHVKDVQQDVNQMFSTPPTYYASPPSGQFKSPKIQQASYYMPSPSSQQQIQQQPPVEVLAPPQVIKDASGMASKSPRLDEAIQRDLKPRAKRGRPKKNRNLHIKLDGINKKPIMGSRLVSSAHSDSGADYWCRTPGGHRVPSALSFTPVHTSLRNGNDSDKHLKFSENEFEFTDDGLGLSVQSFDVTPSMEPPRVNGYFEISSTQQPVLNPGGFFSPGIDANKNGIDQFNETFEEYLKQTDGGQPQSTTGNNNARYDHQQVPFAATVPEFPFDVTSEPIEQQLHAQVVSQPLQVIPLLVEPPEVLQPLLQPEQQQTEMFQLDPAMSFLEPMGTDPFDSSHSEPTPNNDFLSPPDDLSMTNMAHSTINNKRGYSDNIQVSRQHRSLDGSENNSENEAEKYGSRPGIPRSKSDQGVIIEVKSDKGMSGTSPNSSKSSKKRVSRGAVCSVCDKFISRDLTRHMRIHNEIGRFQCIYPKYMCNHRTQYFNRPYDYKKHLLHLHFKFDDPKGKAAHTLTDKLPLFGTCIACGARYSASQWLDFHVLVSDKSQRCAFIEEDKDPQTLA